LLKTCTGCKRELELTEFYKYVSVKNGRYYSKCKSCYAKLNGHAYLKEVIRKCLLCNLSFTPNNGPRKYCSAECFNKARVATSKIRQSNARRLYRDTFYADRLWRSCDYKKYKSKNGYVIAVCKYINIPEHRLIVMRKLGRKLMSWEHVHHIDGNKLNNNIENLRLLQSNEHWEFTKLMEENKILRLKIKELDETILLKGGY